MSSFNKYDLRYLTNRPKTIKWKVVAGNRKLSKYKSYDLIFDDYDLKIRKIDVNDSVHSLA